MAWWDWFTASPGTTPPLGWGGAPDPSWRNAGQNAFEAPDEFDRVRESLPADHPLYVPPAQRAGRAIDPTFVEGKGDRLDIKPNIEGVSPYSGWELESPKLAQAAREDGVGTPSLIERINPTLNYQKDLNTTVAPKSVEPFSMTPLMPGITAMEERQQSREPYSLNPVVRGTVIDAEYEPMTGIRRNAPSQLTRAVQSIPEALKATNFAPMLGNVAMGAIDSLGRSVTAPYRAMNGEIHPDDMFNEATEFALNLGGWGGVAHGLAGAGGRQLGMNAPFKIAEEAATRPAGRQRLVASMYDPAAKRNILGDPADTHGTLAAKNYDVFGHADDMGFTNTVTGERFGRSDAMDWLKTNDPETYAAYGPYANSGRLEAKKYNDAFEKTQPLKGMPLTADVPGFGSLAVGPNPTARAAAESYMKKAGMPYNPQREYVPVDPERAARVADEFERMPHAPHDPEVAASYGALINETKAQFEAMPPDLKIEFIKPGMDDPYKASPRLVQKDIAENNHMWVYPTDSGFGQPIAKKWWEKAGLKEHPLQLAREELGLGPKSWANKSGRYDELGGNADVNRVIAGETGTGSFKSPMLEDSGVVIDGMKLKNNDLFRIVHDYFGHAKEGVGFRATGEDNAFRQHRAMFSPAAQRALTTETRGQNSWLNYGPQGAKNRTAKTEDTVFADQKVGLMPEWTTLYANSKKTAPLSLAAGAASRERNIPGSDWYHGTTHNFDTFDLSKGDPEGYYGRGVYATNNLDDADLNYSSLTGPDLQVKIERRAEQLASEAGEDLYGLPDMDDHFTPQAKSELVGGAAGTVKNLKIKDKGVLKTDKDEIDLYDPHVYQKFSKAVHGAVDRYNLGARDNLDADDLIRTVAEKGDTRARYIDNAIRNYLSDYDVIDGQGRYLSGDVLKDIYKRMGYTGVEMDAFEAFPGMVAPGTRHRTMFKRGTVRDAKSGDVLYANSEKTVPLGLVPALERAANEGGKPQISVAGSMRPEVAEKIGVSPGPIKMAAGDSRYGREHIEQRHGQQLGRYNSASDLVNDVAKNFSQVREAGSGKLMLSKPLGTRGQAAVVVRPQGNEWRVVTGGIFNEKYMSRKSRLYANSKRQAPLSLAASFENDFPFDNPNAKFVGESSFDIGDSFAAEKAYGKPTVEGYDPNDIWNPELYGNPKEIIKLVKTAPENVWLKKLFGVTRQDLYEISQGGTRKGNMSPVLEFPKKGAGKNATNMMTDANAQRMIDTLAEAGKRPELYKGMDAWYVQDPLFWKFTEEFGLERGIKEFKEYNMFTASHSPGTPVDKEITRGTLARMLYKQGRGEEWIDYGNEPRAPHSTIRKDVGDVDAGHMYHRTLAGNTSMVGNLIRTGEMVPSAEAMKVNVYDQALGVPETGFQTSVAVPDSHFSRGAGRADVMPGLKTRAANMKTNEGAPFTKWFREKVAEPLGIESVPAQGRMWGALSNITGVKTAVGKTKLELLVDNILRRSKETGKSPEEVLRGVIRGEEFAANPSSAAPFGLVPALEDER
jgi:hypothetical protein